MSTFGGLNVAYSGLVAARRGLDVVGQNIANANTPGYTRQRISTSAISPIDAGLFTTGARPGEGVSIDGIARLGNTYFDARVRSTAASAGYSAVRANTMSSLETSLHEPGENGISDQLQDFWAAWQDLSNRVGEPSSAGVLLEEARALTAQIATGYGEVENQWSQLRVQVDGMAAELNSTAARVAELNASIRSTLAAGGSVNELLDQRAMYTATIAALAGGTVQEQADGTVNVLIGGNAIVSGDTFRTVKVTGSDDLAGLGGGSVTIAWAGGSTVPVNLDGGEIAGALSMLANADNGGALAQAAKSYNDFATNLAEQVNAIHRGSDPANPGPDFFGLTLGVPPVPAAQGLTVIPTDASGINAGIGGADGSIADAISQLGVGDGSPDSMWSTIVTGIGVATSAEMQHATLADLAASSALTTQLSGASVSLDEENVNLLMYQHAFQGAARVMTAVDEMLDTLINRTGIVGR
ncbi:flagellar hook-associated protein FlgK [Glaciibacter superstes]|uniref:flagellar hook-associated protein FlgK n=1 Tax=Glaciibacter superstes TaxID=501023 RepID=UPI0003B64BAF|nr:flagellar hook-associated protein FlgK [Glaciibacter superstes]